MTHKPGAVEAKSEEKRRPKRERELVEQPSADATGLAQLPGGSMAAVGAGTVETQADRLGDPRLQTAQRQGLATAIGRTQGNRHLQRVVAAKESDAVRPLRAAPSVTDGSEALQLSPLSDELARLWDLGKGPFFDRLRSLQVCDQDVQRFVRENLRGDDRWLAETILRYGPEPLWPREAFAERRRRAREHHWPAEAGHIAGSLGSTRGGRPVTAYYFPGTSDERALIIGGVHGSELSGIQVAEMLLEDLRTGPRPYYSVIIVPRLFPDSAARAEAAGPRPIGTSSEVGRNIGGLDPNRNFPEPGQGLAAAGGRDATRRRQILPENRMLLDLIARFQPSRIASLHAKRFGGRAVRGRAAPGIFADPHTTAAGASREAQQAAAEASARDEQLALEMARTARRRGARVPGNWLDDSATALYGAAPHQRGVSLGTWGPRAIAEGGAEDRPSMTVITVEVQHYEPSAWGRTAEEQEARLRELRAHSASLREIFLGPPAAAARESAPVQRVPQTATSVQRVPRTAMSGPEPALRGTTQATPGHHVPRTAMSGPEPALRGTIQATSGATIQRSPLSSELEQVLITEGRRAFFDRLARLQVCDQDVADLVEESFQGEELRAARRLLGVVPQRNDAPALARVRLEHLFDLYTTPDRQHEPPELGGNIYDHDWIYGSEGSGLIREVIRSKLLTKLDQPRLREWFTGYIQGLAGPQARKNDLLRMVEDVFESPSWRAADQIPINPRWSAWRRRCAELWNTKGQLFADLARALDPGIQPYVAAGIMAAETGQQFFHRGRAIARLEAHVFWNRWGNTSAARRRLFNQHFRRSTPHRWRRGTSGPFRGYHGNQAREWEVLDFARSLDVLADTKAVESTSFGAGQTMGFNFRRVGYGSALEMLADYQTRERAQVEGIFNYIATITPESRKRRVIAAIARENFLPLSQAYGPRDPHGHSQRIARAVRTIRQLVEASRRRREAEAGGRRSPTR